MVRIRDDIRHVFKAMIDNRVINEIPREMCVLRQTPTVRLDAEFIRLPNEKTDDILDGIQVSGQGGILYFSVSRPPYKTFLGIGTCSSEDAFAGINIPLRFLEPYSVHVSFQFVEKDARSVSFRFLKYPTCFPRISKSLRNSMKFFRVMHYWFFRDGKGLYRVLDSDFHPLQNPWRYMDPRSLSLDFIC